MNSDLFKEFIKEIKPNNRDKVYAWRTAVGLQDVDNLKPSSYLINLATRNIKGEITLKEISNLIDAFYKEKPQDNKNQRIEEADKVSLRIVSMLSEKSFSFTPNEYILIHRKLFTGIYNHAGVIRDYNITKNEDILNGETVTYGSFLELKEALYYDFAKEKKFSYQNLSTNEVIKHLALFISNLWQNHIFGEGNTRTTAVFLIKYLRKLGLNVTNDTFANNSKYFRNSLVRANYNDYKKGIYENREYLELFLRKLLLNEENPLKNQELHISWLFFNIKPDIDVKKSNIEV